MSGCGLEDSQIDCFRIELFQIENSIDFRLAWKAAYYN